MEAGLGHSYPTELPSLHQLLPRVTVEESVQRHVRTLFYSSTRNHECLANLSARLTTTVPSSAALLSGVGDSSSSSPSSSSSLGATLHIHAVLPSTYIQPVHADVPSSMGGAAGVGNVTTTTTTTATTATTTIPLLSKLDSTVTRSTSRLSSPPSSSGAPSAVTAPPPFRRPVHLHSNDHCVHRNCLFALFPASATCQICPPAPPLQVHVRLPRVRLSLSDAADVSRSGVKLVENSTYILLSTHQLSSLESLSTTGMLLSSRVKRRSHRNHGHSGMTTPVEYLEPVSYDHAMTNIDSFSHVAGIWTATDDPVVISLAVHTLAASWWSRRNKRLALTKPRPNNSLNNNNNKLPPLNPSGDWYERRLWLVHFDQHSPRIAVKSGSLAVCDDLGAHYAASLPQASTAASPPVRFELQRHHPTSDHPSHPSAESHDRAQRSSHGEDILSVDDDDAWNTGWVTVPTANESHQAHQRYRRQQRERESQPALSKPRNHSTRQSRRPRASTRNDHSPLSSSSSSSRQLNQSSSANSSRHRYSYRSRDSADDPGSILNAKMHLPNYQLRRNEIVLENSSSLNIDAGVNADPPNDSASELQPQQNEVTIIDTPELNELDSDGELDSETNMNMDELCRKYLNISYDEGIQRVSTSK